MPEIIAAAALSSRAEGLPVPRLRADEPRTKMFTIDTPVSFFPSENPIDIVLAWQYRFSTNDLLAGQGAAMLDAFSSKNTES